MVFTAAAEHCARKDLLLLLLCLASRLLCCRSAAYCWFCFRRGLIAAGTIPGVDRLGCLKAACLRGSQFSGEIPSDFFLKMKSLKKVWLSDNKFSGGIPSSLA
ncbi:hypothetical protein SADUNF_Sadunf03G0042700 [Salix dunnii]|uniref:Uncharacterized protein n=1 Tax=Salix dunnii TaxID=1413687 RepID=A0A835N1L6_9ROSI|nr:hypothetical protein SADUNF_Sadunf03G0042700 [Salix dunnii]